MISCKTLIHASAALKYRYIQKSPEEGPVCFQLSANNPHELAEGVKIATAAGADLIDLNCGCPVKKIRSKGAGSRLLSEPAQLYALITAMKQNTHLPVSIKIRVQGNSGDSTNQTIAQVVRDAGADFLIVHGRHWTEHYETPVRHDQIQFFVEELAIPVIGNGDITGVASAQAMFATGCAGVMVGRAGVGQPWLIGQLIAELQNESFRSPSTYEIGQMFMHHVSQLVILLQSETFALLQARKFAKYYARGLANRADFGAEMNRCESLEMLRMICANYFNA